MTIDFQFDELSTQDGKRASKQIRRANAAQQRLYVSLISRGYTKIAQNYLNAVTCTISVLL